MTNQYQDSGKPLFVLIHMGAGDALLCNGLIRVLADRHGKVIVPAYPHNVQAVTFMFRDDPRIEVVECQNSTHACAQAIAHDNFLPLGYYSKSKFDPRFFDKEFYSQANVEFKERWDRFYVQRDNGVHCDIKLPSFAFVHHDPKRGFEIDHNKIPDNICFASLERPFFDWLDMIEQASEIHCINSSFLILVDSLPDIPGQKLFFHRYPRPTDYPTLKKDWTIIL